MTDPVPTPTGRRIHWYSPHQDDETLWAGQILAHHTLVGREAHIVLATDGSTSGVLPMLNGTTTSGWWGGYHYPEREGIPPLTPADFAAARDRELVQAARQLGVSPDRVHLRVDERSSGITVADAEALILSFETAAPGSGHYTMHWADLDPVHAALGQALHNLVTRGAVTDARWIVRREQTTTIPGTVAYTVPSQYAAQARHMALCAARCYQAWAPPEAYAIGNHSVASDFTWATSPTAANYIVTTP